MKKSLIAAAIAAASFAPAAVMAQAAAPAAAVTPTVGAKVYAPDGSDVGTVEQVANGVVTVNTGTARAGLPTSSFAMRAKGLTIGMTKAQVEAAVGSAKAESDAAKDSALVVDAAIKSSDGVDEGIITNVQGDNVTFELPDKRSAILQKAYFSVGEDGSVALTMTDAAFKSALGASAAAAPAAAPTDAASAPAAAPTGN
ncbi:hypothetical protein [Novosphingobium sp. 9]|uniref:hypothetical protein n=1 Tax=Novosphingobium sp. 9 TaxID=2025349 RepID=UPI0021B604A6|nr:hypothetical protein [Novosphingobium sp. 9]